MEPKTVSSEAPDKNTERWIIAKVGNVEVPAYRLCDGRICISYYEGSQRKRKHFKNEKDAKREASLIAAKINAGQQDVLQLSSADRDSYVLATKHLAAMNTPLHVAAEEYAIARAKLPTGVALLAAVEFYNSRHASLIGRKNVADVVAEFIEAKEQDGRSDRYLRVVQNELKRFSTTFGMPITEVTAPKIEHWLRSLGVAPRSRKNLRGIIVTLFNFARARGYLPREQQTEANYVARISAKAGDVGVFTPVEVRSLLENASDEVLPFIAIGAFAGVRTAEILRLEWEDIRWDQNFIILNRNKTKTATRRIVPLLPNLAAWLAPYRGRTGKVCIYVRTQRCAKRLGAQLKIKWRKNVLRHSFISYRVAACQNVHQVALECGNSPRVIDSNYRELVPPKQAEEYFAIMPPTATDGIIQMPVAA